MSFTKELELPVEPLEKKFKASDLPLSSATRSAIEGLAHTFKKKGGYDALRKQVWEKFEASVRQTLVWKLAASLLIYNLNYRTTKPNSKRQSLKKQRQS